MRIAIRIRGRLENDLHLHRDCPSFTSNSCVVSILRQEGLAMTEDNLAAKLLTVLMENADLTGIEQVDITVGHRRDTSTAVYIREGLS